MSPGLISIYQVFVTAFLIAVFIIFWSRAYVLDELFIIEHKIDRLLNEREKFHNLALKRAHEITDKTKEHKGTE